MKYIDYIGNYLRKLDYNYNITKKRVYHHAKRV